MDEELDVAPGWPSLLRGGSTAKTQQDLKVELSQVEFSLTRPTTLIEAAEQIRDELSKFVIGYEQASEQLVTAAVAGGHVLLEGPPGVGKTLVAGTVARVLGCSFKRIQFTPDTLPDHIVGSSVLKMGEPHFVPGAIFANVVLADEINRTPPRAQAALLEAMEEGHVTVDGRTHWLPTPFMVVATQNPYEQTGVFPLPESQLDRFLFRIVLDYLPAADELKILRLPRHGLSPDVLGEVQPVLDVVSLERLRQEIARIDLPQAVAEQLVRLVRATREHKDVYLGAGPRAIVHLAAASKASACLHGRHQVTAADVQQMAPSVLTHRIVMREGTSATAVADALAGTFSA
jgi:MoxR-like ATPase